MTIMIFKDPQFATLVATISILVITIFLAGIYTILKPIYTTSKHPHSVCNKNPKAGGDKNNVK